MQIKNSVENVLIARVCHDLITHCNAINLGLEAYEMSADNSLLTCIKDSSIKANIVLKFMRELFQNREEGYKYSVSNLQGTVIDFLKVYNIEGKVVTNEIDIPIDIGSIVMFDTVIMKEIMPLGGKVMFNVGADFVNVIYSGSGIIELDAEIPIELTYKNVLRFKLLHLLQDLSFSINSLIENGEGKIMEIRE